MKRVLLFLFVVLGLAASGFAQNDKISYQAVVRNSANQIVYNTELTVTINIANSEGGEVVYSERHTVTSNANGLISLLIGDGEVLSGSWDAVPWNTAYMSASIANTGSSETVAAHALPLSAVPYAMYANYADSVNTEVIAHYLLENGYLAVDSTLFFNLLDSLRMLDLRLVADSVEFADYLSNTSAQIETTLDSIVYILNYLQMMNHAIDGDFTDLVDSIGAISWRQTNNYYTKSVIDEMLSHYATRAALDSTNAAIRADFPVVNNATLTIRSNGDSVGVFTANANENVTINIPAQANVQSDWNVTDTTSDAFIKHKPDIPTVPTNVSAFTNDAGYITTADIPTNVSVFTNDVGYITSDTVGNAIHDSIVNNISQQIHDSISVHPETDPLFTAWDKNYNDLTNKPELFDGNYNSLTNKPSIKDSVSNAIHDSIVSNISQQIHDSISNIQIGSDNVQSDWNQTDTTADDYIKHKPELFSGNYEDLTNKPTIPTVPTNVGAFANDAGYITSETVGNAIHDSIVNNISQQIHDSIYSHPETDPLFSAWDKDYNDLTNKPDLFDGNYNSLTNKPSIKDTVSNAIHDSIVNNISQQIHDSISHIQIGSDNVQSDWAQTDTTADDYIKHKPELFSGNYDDLTNKPTIPTVPTDVSTFTNDAGYLTSDSALIVNMLDSLHNLTLRLIADSTALQHHIAGTSTIPQTIDSIRTALANINVTNQAVNGDFSQLIADINTLTARLNNDYYTKTKINDTLDDYYTKTQVDSVSTQIRSEIPAVHNATLTIKSNGDSIGVFTANANQNVTIDIPAQANVQSDWAQTDTTADDYIKHKPELFSGNYDDLANKPELFSGDYDDLTNKPELFDGDYNSLTSKPSIKDTVSEAIHDSIVNRISAQIHDSISHIQIGSDNVQSDWNQTDTTADDYIKHKPELFSGNYDDLTNKPTIPTVPTDVSTFTNDAGYLTSDSALIVNMLDSLHNLTLRLIADSTALQHHIAGTSTIPQTIDSIRTALANINVTNQAVNGDFSQLIGSINTLTARLNNDYYTKVKINDTLDDYYTKSQVDSVSTQIRSEIPAVHNATLTIKSNGDSIGVFTANANQNVTIDIPAQANVQSDWAQTDTTADDYIKHKPELFSGNYDDLANKPELFSGDYDDLTNKPELFDGDYNSLTSKPSIKDTLSEAIHDSIVNRISQQIHDSITVHPETDPLFTAWGKDYNTLLNKPVIKDTVSAAIHDSIVNRISQQIHDSITVHPETDPLFNAWGKDYTTLVNKPSIKDTVSAAIHDSIVNRISQQIHDSIDGIHVGDDNVQSNWNVTDNTSDAFILNKPTKLTDFENDAAYITASDIPANVSVFTNDAGYLTADSALIVSLLDSLQNLSLRLKADSAALQSHLSGTTHSILQEIDSIKIALASINITNQAVNGDFTNLLNSISDLTFRLNNHYYTILQVDSISSKIRSEIPTVNNATLTIKNNGESLGQFTANANQNVTIDVSALSNVQSDWNQADNTKDDYIKNKPNIKDTVSEAIHDSIVNRISAQIHDSISGITETDPTVPAWAKAENKPTYNYSEILNTPDIPAAQVQSDWNATEGLGVILNKPAIPTVPANVSAFTNDAGYITGAAIHDSIVNRISQQIHDSISGITETDPTVPAWAKTTDKPTYDYSEIENTPAIPTVPTDISAFNNDSGYLTEYTETDPTVPAWAKAAEKPTYDYSEIENTPAIPTVPTDISAFNNDSGYLTEYTESDPTVPAWAKEAEKPTYDYSEIENTPAIPTVPTNISAFTNDAGFITAADIPNIQDIPTNLSEFNNDAGFITSYTETDPQFNAWDKDYNDLINTPSINDSISEAIHDSLNMLKKGIRDVTDTAYTSSLLPVEKSKILIIDEDQDPQMSVVKICQLDKKPNNAYLVKIFINGVLVGDNAPANGGSDSHYAPVLRVEQNSSEKYEIKYDSDKNEGYLLEKGDKIILYWFE